MRMAAVRLNEARGVAISRGCLVACAYRNQRAGLARCVDVATWTRLATSSIGPRLAPPRSLGDEAGSHNTSPQRTEPGLPSAPHALCYKQG